MRLVAIVDDEAVRAAVKDLLDYAGFATAAFASAESLLQSDRLPNVARLVTDLCMPGMDGLELHQQRQAAEDGAGENCVSRRWELGWASYLSAAVAHGSEQGGTR